jgi:hypothetical protein
MDVTLPAGRTLEVEATLLVPAEPGRKELISETKATVTVTTSGRVTIPINSFDFNKGQPGFLHYIRGLQFAGKFTDGASGVVKLKNVRLIRARDIALDAPVRGKAVVAGGTTRYEVTVSNCTESPQVVKLGFEKYGWEAFPAMVEPAQLTLAPGATGTCVVSVNVPAGVPAGGHERQKLTAGSTTLELITACDVPRPHILMTRQGWDEIRAKVQKYDWAREGQAEYVKTADEWKVPEVATPEQRAKAPENHPYVFLNRDFDKLYPTAVAWQLTGKKEHAEKVALFLRRLADEKTGYASTCAGTSMGEPQEGGNFQGVAIAYDAILDAGVLSEDDRRAIEKMLRLFRENFEDGLTVGNIGNWSTAASTAALMCSLALGDLAAAAVAPFITTPEHPYWQIIPGLIVMPLLVITNTIAGAILPDICDVDELETGQRREGLFTSVMGFVGKLEISLAVILVGYIVTWAQIDTKIGHRWEGLLAGKSSAFPIGEMAVFELKPTKVDAVTLTSDGLEKYELFVSNESPTTGFRPVSSSEPILARYLKMQLAAGKDITLRELRIGDQKPRLVASQPAERIQKNLFWIVMSIGIVFTFLTMLMAFLFPLTEAQMKEVRRQLDARHHANPETAPDDEE